ncbi:Rossmann-like and DUF2520 domain-containing protein [Portibacter lacus]|uniref:DUF2520 domain-containing protein n=1 Tax=Portibacter lacus TaxID=1099794 RepID=A0AA37SR81_9BACT|nr:DUF2520 domain-containing protein [Portibacter lacus]GLR16265.1 hypothetical protein GCM10007940_08800 [Portibacter lacus]
MLNAVIFGTGNIASHFTPAISKIAELNVSSIFARSEEKARLVIGDGQINIIYNYAAIPEDTDVVFLMVNDDAIKSVTAKLSEHLQSSTMIIHFSGSMGLSEIHEHFHHTGIMWPIQTISKSDSSLVLKETPLSISFSDEYTKEKLDRWAAHLSNHKYYLSEDQKKVVHLSAVFANNFTNHMYVIAKELLNAEGLNFELITPLILKTAQSALYNDPALNQTGPAKRQDKNTMDKQLDLLSDVDQKAIYQLISKNIDKKNNS